MAQQPYSDGSYWVVQLVVCGIFGFAGVIGGPIAMRLDTEEPGRGLIYFLIGVAFLFFFVRLLRKFFSSSRKQRAAYAWVIMQQNSELQADGVNIDNDGWAMHMAERARTGKITASEVAALQAKRPDVPYPGETPDPRNTPATRS